MVDFFRPRPEPEQLIPDDLSPPDTGPLDTLGLLTPGQLEDMRLDREARDRLRAENVPLPKEPTRDVSTVLVAARVRFSNGMRGMKTEMGYERPSIMRWCK